MSLRSLLANSKVSKYRGGRFIVVCRSEELAEHDVKSLIREIIQILKKIDLKDMDLK